MYVSNVAAPTPNEVTAMSLKISKALRRVESSKNSTLKRGYEPYLVRCMFDILYNPTKERFREIDAMIRVLGSIRTEGV